MNLTSMKIVFVVLVTLAMLTMTATPVLAASPPQPITRLNGVGASAQWPGPVGQFSNIQLLVDKTSAGTDVLLLVDMYV